MKASICLFQNNIKYIQDGNIVDIPDTVFNAVQKVLKNHNTEIVKSEKGFFVIEFCEQGPFKDGFGLEDWLPVKVYRIEKWNSGGVTGKEMFSFVSEKNSQHQANEKKSQEI